MNQLAENLIHRLEDKGLSLIAIPRFVKDVANTVSINHHAGLQDVNRRLDLLGWGPVELDYHTLQLIIASLENGGLTTVELAAYNAGSARVRKYQDVPPIRITQLFVKKALEYYGNYKRERKRAGSLSSKNGFQETD